MASVFNTFVSSYMALTRAQILDPRRACRLSRIVGDAYHYQQLGSVGRPRPHGSAFCTDMAGTVTVLASGVLLTSASRRLEGDNASARDHVEA